MNEESCSTRGCARLPVRKSSSDKHHFPGLNPFRGDDAVKICSGRNGIPVNVQPVPEGCGPSAGLVIVVSLVEGTKLKLPHFHPEDAIDLDGHVGRL